MVLKGSSVSACLLLTAQHSLFPGEKPGTSTSQDPLPATGPQELCPWESLAGNLETRGAIFSLQPQAGKHHKTPREDFAGGFVGDFAGALSYLGVEGDEDH